MIINSFNIVPSTNGCTKPCSMKAVNGLRLAVLASEQTKLQTCSSAEPDRYLTVGQKCTTHARPGHTPRRHIPGRAKCSVTPGDLSALRRGARDEIPLEHGECHLDLLRALAVAPCGHRTDAPGPLAARIQTQRPALPQAQDMWHKRAPFALSQGVSHFSEATRLRDCRVVRWYCAMMVGGCVRPT